MSTPFEDFFGGNIFYINLAKRVDRRDNFENEMRKIGVTCHERFEAIDAGPYNGNVGCCASHRAVLDLIVQRGLERAVVFEDDSVIWPGMEERFNTDVIPPLQELPEEWDVLYLGGGYGDDPQGWHSRHLIRINAMKTTSSYAVTAKAARELRDYIPEICSDGIDNIFSGYTPSHQSFICEPRFFIQYENFSDLQQARMFNGGSMMDRGHTNRLGPFRPR